MELSLFQDSEKNIHSAEKKLPHMKAFSLCIDKKQQKFLFEKPNNQKTKQNVIFKAPPKWVKMHFLCFYPFFELTSDSLTPI